MIVDARSVAGSDAHFQKATILRRALGPSDVEIDIAYCGICHTDLHQVRDWPGTRFPCVPGHEIAGFILSAGSQVERFAPGDTVGVGCIVDSCRHCMPCLEGTEQFCEAGFTNTYNSPTAHEPGYTLGGYSRRIVVDERYVVRVSHDPGQLPAVAPLLCAGITTYSALKHWEARAGTRVGIVGIGGLGHVGIRIANALGCHVVAFTTSEAKRADAIQFGAHEVVVSTNHDEMAMQSESLDLILDTVAAPHELDDFLLLLKRDGQLILVGAPGVPNPPFQASNLFRRRRSITGSLIGGIAETQEMLDFCARHGIVADIELIDADRIDEAFDRIARNDVRYRFVIDGATI